MASEGRSDDDEVYEEDRVRCALRRSSRRRRHDARHHARAGGDRAARADLGGLHRPERDRGLHRADGMHLGAHLRRFQRRDHREDGGGRRRLRPHLSGGRQCPADGRHGRARAPRPGPPRALRRDLRLLPRPSGCAVGRRYLVDAHGLGLNPAHVPHRQVRYPTDLGCGAVRPAIRGQDRHPERQEQHVSDRPPHVWRRLRRLRYDRRAARCGQAEDDRAEAAGAEVLVFGRRADRALRQRRDLGLRNLGRLSGERAEEDGYSPSPSCCRWRRPTAGRTSGTS